MGMGMDGEEFISSCSIFHPFVVIVDHTIISCNTATISSSPRRRKRFHIDTEVCCVGAHPHFWPFESARVKPN